MYPSTNQGTLPNVGTVYFQNRLNVQSQISYNNRQVVIKLMPNACYYPGNGMRYFLGVKCKMRKWNNLIVDAMV